MFYRNLALLAAFGTAVCLPQSFDTPFSDDLSARDLGYDLDTFEALVAKREALLDIEERDADEEMLLYDRSDESSHDLAALLYARATAAAKGAPKPPVPPKPDNLKAPKTNAAKPASPAPAKAPAPASNQKTPAQPAKGPTAPAKANKGSATDWTKKVQEDAKKANAPKWYNKLGIGHKDKKKDSENPVPHLEKIASQQAHKITGYNRAESDKVDKDNNKARIKNHKEEEINKQKASTLTNYNSDMRYFNTAKDVLNTGVSLSKIIKRELARREAYASYLESDSVYARNPYAEAEPEADADPEASEYDSYELYARDAMAFGTGDDNLYE